MPAYDAAATSVNKPVLTPGRPVTVWDGLASPPDVVAAGDASQQVCLHRKAHEANVLSVQIEFGGDPGAFNVALETSDVDEDKYYTTKAALNSGLNTNFVGRIEAQVVAKFARLRMVTLTNPVTVVAKFF